MRRYNITRARLPAFCLGFPFLIRRIPTFYAKLCNMIRKLSAVFLILYLAACETDSKRATTPQTPYYGSKRLSKTCQDGSSSIEIIGRATSYSSSGSSSYSGFSDTSFQPGDKVMIKGHSKENNPCLSGGGFTFQCEGTVQIGENRSFICNGGHIQPGSGGSYYSGSYSTSQSYHTSAYGTSAYGTHSAQVSIQQGLVITYGNGTKFYAQITFSHPSFGGGGGGGGFFGGFPCKASFVCQSSR